MSAPVTAAPPSAGVGIVKAVLSGDTLVLRTALRPNAPFKQPLERVVSLSYVQGPRLHEVGGWQSRAFLRNLVIGKEVKFSIDYSVPTQQGPDKEYGSIYVRDEATREPVHVATVMVTQGFLKVRPESVSRHQKTSMPPVLQELLSLEAKAVAAKKGLHADALPHYVIQPLEHLEDAQRLFNTHKNKSLRAMVDYIRDGSSLRVILLPDNDRISPTPHDHPHSPTTPHPLYSLQVQLSGIRCPSVTTTARSAEPYGDEAKYFTESRLLHRTISIILESLVSGTHGVWFFASTDPDVTESLVREGLARVMDSSIALVHRGTESLRQAERDAFLSQKRLYQPASSSAMNVSPTTATVFSSSSPSLIKGNTYEARVVKVHSGDSLSVLLDYQPPISAHLSKPLHRVFLSHVRLPRDHPNAEHFMSLSKEYLRRRLIAQKVSLTVDYVLLSNPTVSRETASDQSQEQQQARVFVSLHLPRKCPTLKDTDVSRYDQLFTSHPSNSDTIHSNNSHATHPMIHMNTLLTVEGLVYVNKVKTPSGAVNAGASQGEMPQRALLYDRQLLAETRAQQEKRGLYSTTENSDRMPASMRLNNASASLAKARQHFVSLSGKRWRGIVEHVIAGSKLKIHLTKEGCSLILLLGGLRGLLPVSAQAMQYTTLRCYQQEVELTVESVDRQGHFVGQLQLLDGGKLDQELVREGLALVFQRYGDTAREEESRRLLLQLQEEAVAKKKGVWQTHSLGDFVSLQGQRPDEEEEEGNTVNDSEKKDKTDTLYMVRVTSLDTDRVYVQTETQMDTLVALNQRLQKYCEGLVQERCVWTRGMLVGALSRDGCWYRGRIVRVREREREITVQMIDYGGADEEVVEIDDVRSLAAGEEAFTKTLPLVTACRWAGMRVPKAGWTEVLSRLREDNTYQAEVAYRKDVESGGGNAYYRLRRVSNGQSMNEEMVREGWAVMAMHAEKDEAGIQQWTRWSEEARRERRGLYRYGDIRLGDEVE